MTPVCVGAVNMDDVISVAPDKGKSQENSAKVATELTQEGVGTSKLPEPECGVLLVVPAEQDGLDHVDTHGKDRVTTNY